MGKLSALKVKTLKEPGRYSDGEGLMLKIGPTGGRSWIVRVQTNGRRRDVGLGNARNVSLTEAREAATEIRKNARLGADPLAERLQQRLVIPTFREAAHLVHKELLKGWKNGKHTDQWLTTLQNYAFPKIGSLPVDQIEGPLVRDLLAAIWLDKPETARRVKQRIGTILDWCYSKGLRSSEAPLRSISKGLPRQLKKKGHFAAMAHKDLPGFLASLASSRASMGKLALRALIFTAARSGEIRGATWSELNNDYSEWTIPGERMKIGVDHRVPLFEPARAVFRQAALVRLAGCDLVFPGQALFTPLSDMTLLKILRDANVAVTVHGFRSTFRDWVADETDYPREIAEAALAHTLENKVEAAYRRTDFFAKRRKLMDDWGCFCMSAGMPISCG
jgi:integrase